MSYKAQLRSRLNYAFHWRIVHCETGVVVEVGVSSNQEWATAHAREALRGWVERHERGTWRDLGGEGL